VGLRYFPGGKNSIQPTLRHIDWLPAGALGRTPRAWEPKPVRHSMYRMGTTRAVGGFRAYCARCVHKGGACMGSVPRHLARTCREGSLKCESICLRPLVREDCGSLEWSGNCDVTFGMRQAENDRPSPGMI
jgi:hypothetical protein